MESSQIDCTITGPGMLIESFKLVTDRDALSGCDAQFYRSLADDLDVKIFCGHRKPSTINVRVEPHRLGPELTISVGPPSMYQSLVRLRTISGRTFRQLLLDSMGADSAERVIAVLYTVRAKSHEEHHASASKTIEEHATRHGQHGGGQDES